MTTNIINQSSSASAVASSLAVETIRSLTAAENTDQSPATVDQPLQIKFGPPVSNEDFDVDALGSITCKNPDEYLVRALLQVGRTTNPGVSDIYIRALLNGVQQFAPVYAELPNQSTIVPLTFFSVIAMDMGDVLSLEVYRDSSGTDNGGVLIGNSGLWGIAPSARITLSRNVIMAV